MLKEVTEKSDFAFWNFEETPVHLLSPKAFDQDMKPLVIINFKFFFVFLMEIGNGEFLSKHLKQYKWAQKNRKDRKKKDNIHDKRIVLVVSVDHIYTSGERKIKTEINQKLPASFPELAK